MAGEVWLRAPRAARASPPLTRDRIVTEAVALLDEDGAAGLTMRRLAARLGAGSTTLYWHVRTKDDVLDLALDTIFRDVPLPATAGEWAADVRALIGDWYAVMLRHRWAPGLLGRPMLGPNVLARTEFLQASLTRGGFTGDHLAVATHGLANYVIGAALTRVGSGALNAADEHVRAHATEYPTLAATGHLGERDWDVVFRAGLDSFLAGLIAGRR
ncbi:TetR/AcrR family transcriptional regulator C-terminal domain-containing protein [Actinophytocola sediminis]